MSDRPVTQRETRFQWTSVGILVLVLILATLAATNGFVGLRLDQVSPAAVGKVLVTLVFVALVIERAVEVYVANTFEPRKARLRQGITIAENRLAQAEETLAAETARQAARNTGGDDRLLDLRRKQEAAAGEVDRAKAEAVDDLIDHRARKMVWAGGAATLLSFMAAGVGVRVLEPLLHGAAGAGAVETFAATASDLQLGAFRVADTLLTTFVLAGGADGIHKIIKAVSLHAPARPGG